MTKEELISKEEYGYDENKGIWSKYYKKFLKGYVNKNGYVTVRLNCIDENDRAFYVHRALWYLAYGVIPEGLQVNHINEDKTDNRLCNLNLMTPKENSNWGTHNERMTENLINNSKLSKPVVAVDNEGIVVLEFESTREAERHGFNSSVVSKCCREEYYGKCNRFFKGYYWFFKKDWEQMQIEKASPHKREDAYQLEINFV